MRRLLTILLVAFSICSLSCTGGDKGGDSESLSLSGHSLSFTSDSSESQNITVTAKGVDWKVEVDSGSSDWLTAVKDGEKVVVSVKVNSSMQPRTGEFSVVPAGGTLDSQKVTVTQAGSDTPPVFDLLLEPSLLNFESEGAAVQEVTVTTEGEGLTWSAVVEDKSKGWISIEVVGDKIRVSVKDNPDSSERAGNVMVTASESSVSKKAVRVVQAKKVLPPSLAVQSTEPINFEFDDKDSKIAVDVIAVNLTWTAAAVDDAGKPVTWVSIRTYVGEERSFVEVTPTANEEKTPRTCYVVLTPSVESVKPVKITVNQEAFRDIFSDLTGPVVIPEKLQNQRTVIYPSQTWAGDDVKSTYWILRFMGDGMTWNDAGPKVTGKGVRIEIDLHSSRINYNDNNEYDLPAGEYNVVSGDASEPFTISAGTKGWNHPRYPAGGWYFSMDGDTYLNQAPLTGGKMTVSKKGNITTIVFDFLDDAGNKITGKYEGELSINVSGEPSPAPNPGDPDPWYVKKR